MVRPLYKCTPEFNKTNGHKGLWFDKFCDQWNDESWSLDTNKSEWAATVKGAAGNQSQLTEYRDRMLELIGDGDYLVFDTISNLVSGLGRTNPIENGFVWHQTLGTPYIPGSSIKGAVRAWARESGLDDQKIIELFGAENSSDKPSKGSVIFFDALPTKQCTIMVDVMTPHYGPWYQNGEVPGDWHSPTPIPFLSVKPGASFLFLWKCKNKTDQDQVKNLVCDALLELGLGAKTSSGYGRFKPDDSETQNRKDVLDARAKQKAEEAKLAGMKEWDRDFHEHGGNQVKLAKFIVTNFEGKSEDYKQGFVDCILQEHKRKKLKEAFKDGGIADKEISSKQLKQAWDLIIKYLPEG
ncbi:MAG: type III-B CRISPR module RAMP protein Cmr6 [Candidatus Cloacimonetes bacterium]|nr:type III-B CRISPR module RAMP protein Cmr6 [Candidatus Cloacimonadota bacterium]